MEKLTAYQKARRWLHTIYLSIENKNEKKFRHLLSEREEHLRSIKNIEAEERKFMVYCAAGIKAFNL